MNTSTEYGYYAKQVSLELDITTSTLRRWAITLEHAGYSFERNDKDQRIYFQRDFRVFKELKQLLASGVSMENAVKAVIANLSNYENASQTPSVHIQKTHLSVSDLQEIIQQEVRKAVEAEREILLDALEQKLSNQVERRDRELLASIAEMQEAKLVAAATKEKEKKWYQFWR